MSGAFFVFLFYFSVVLMVWLCVLVLHILMQTLCKVQHGRSKNYFFFMLYTYNLLLGITN